MQRNLERRLQAVETRLYEGPEDAAHFRKVAAMSEEELDAELEMMTQQLSETELDLLLRKFDLSLQAPSAPSQDRRTERQPGEHA